MKNSQKTKKLILQTQQRFKSETHNVFTEEINQIALNLDDDKRVESNDSTETYAFGTIKDLFSENKKRLNATK